MQSRIATCLLTSYAATLAYIYVRLAWLVPRLLLSAYGMKSLDEVQKWMSPVTRLAINHSWFIASVFGAVWFVSVLALRRFPDKLTKCVTVGLCAQGLVAWSAMLCLLFDELLGPMSLHHNPAFDFGTFVAFGGGVFPISLILIIAPMIVALSPSKMSKP